jgi:UDP-N-acetylglucosamine:LPS N-acetylglucosamine transferase
MKEAIMKKILFVSVQGAMGHITRDVAIVKQLRRLNSDIEVSWIAHPLACKVLADAGETVLPESQLVADYNLAAVQVVNGFRLNVMKYVGLMKKPWAQNVDLFKQVITKYDFDLVIGDEFYEGILAMADNKLDLKCKMIMMEDFIGLEAMSNNLLEKLGVYLHNRGHATLPAFLSSRVTRFFVGELEDVPDKTYGIGLAKRRDITKKYYEILGYVIRFDPAEYSDKAKIRAKLGYGKEPLLICATGGTCAGNDLVELCGKAYTILKKDIPDLRMVAVCGELFGTKPPVVPEGVKLHTYIPDLYEHYAACDMAVVVGGGTTTTELTALRRPFIFFPLENQFDQQLYIAERLARHRAGIKMRYYETTPDSLAEAIRNNIGKEATWPPIRTDGAEKAAMIISQMLNGTS